MYNGIGLQTARGSSTSGYVQKNLSYVKPEFFRNKVEQTTGGGFRRGKNYDDSLSKSRNLNKELLDHNRKHAIESKVYELRVKLEDEGKDEEYIENECSKLRDKLTQSTDLILSNGKGKTDTHEISLRKEKELARLRDAFAVDDDFKPGASFDPEHQERKREKEREDRQRQYDQRQKERAERELARKLREEEDKRRKALGENGYKDRSENREKDDRRGRRTDSRGRRTDSRGRSRSRSREYRSSRRSNSRDRRRDRSRSRNKRLSRNSRDRSTSSTRENKASSNRQIMTEKRKIDEQEEGQLPEQPVAKVVEDKPEVTEKETTKEKHKETAKTESRVEPKPRSRSNSRDRIRSKRDSRSPVRSSRRKRHASPSSSSSSSSSSSDSSRSSSRSVSRGRKSTPMAKRSRRDDSPDQKNAVKGEGKEAVKDKEVRDVPPEGDKKKQITESRGRRRGRSPSFSSSSSSSSGSSRSSRSSRSSSRSRSATPPRRRR